MSGHTALSFSKTRCDGGTLYRHDPCPDDPHFEMEIGQCPECGGRGCERRPDTVTIVLPSGYASAEGFAKDCGFELSNSHADLVKALRTCRDRLKADLDEIEHLRGWLSEAELAERALQDEHADQMDKLAIFAADEALATLTVG